MLFLNRCRQYSIRLSLAAVALLVLAVLPAAAQDSWNVELLGKFGERGAGRTSYKDVWGYVAPDGTELAILGTTSGISIVDVTVPETPVEVAFILMPARRIGTCARMGPTPMPSMRMVATAWPSSICPTRHCRYW